MEQDYNLKNWTKPCPKVNCKKSCSGLRYVVIPAALGDDSKDSDVAPKNGAYCNAMVKYEANNNVYLYSSEGVPVMVDENLWPTIEGIQEDIETLATNDSSAACYTTGIKLSGTYKNEWHTRFSDRTSNPYRKTIVA